MDDQDIPILGDVDVSHAEPKLPVPLGVRAEMDADALKLSLLEPVVTTLPSVVPHSSRERPEDVKK